MPLRTASSCPAGNVYDKRRAPQPVQVTFQPPSDRFYRSRFRFVVNKGSSFDVVLTGKGSFMEGAGV